MSERTRNPDRAGALRENLAALFGLGTPDSDHLRTVLSKVAPEDIADLLEDFGDDDKLLLFRAMPSDEDRGVVLEETDQASRDDLLENLSTPETVAILGEMPVDDLVDHLEELPAEDRARVLANLEPDEAREVEELLQFAPDTAGGLMTTEFLSVPLEVTSLAALQEIQGNLDAETISYVYVVESEKKLCGVVSIREVLRAKPSVPVKEYMATDLITADLHTDQEEVAAAANKYNLSVIPVVDETYRLRGIVTMDDLLDAVEEEHSEDMLRMAGTVAVNPYHESVYAGVAKRLPFLVLTMVGGLGVVFLGRLFEDRGEVLAAVLIYLPLLLGLSGNVAIVTSTVIVRGLATGEINLQRLWKAVRQDFLIGTLIGVVVSVVVGLLIAFVVEKDGDLGWALACGLVVSVSCSALIGAMVPIGCRLSGRIDPAIASGPFVTMLCDLTVALIFFYMIEKMLSGA